MLSEKLEPGETALNPERAYELLVHLWTKALLERFRTPSPPFRVGVIDLWFVAAIAATSVLGDVPARALSGVYEFVRRPVRRLTTEQRVVLRILGRGWVEVLRSQISPKESEGRQRGSVVSFETALPAGRTPLDFPDIRVPADILSASFGVSTEELLEVLKMHAPQVFVAAIAYGPKEQFSQGRAYPEGGDLP